MQEVQETPVQPLGLQDPLEEEMATYSSILAWRNPKDRGAWRATVQTVRKSQTRLIYWACKSTKLLCNTVLAAFKRNTYTRCWHKERKQQQKSPFQHTEWLVRIWHCFNRCPIHPTLPFPHCAHRSVLYLHLYSCPETRFICSIG